MWHISYVCLFFKFGFYVILKHRNEAEILQDYKIKIHTDFSVDLVSLIIPSDWAPVFGLKTSVNACLQNKTHVNE